MDNSKPSKRGRKLGQISEGTARALALFDAGQVTPYAAAKACGIHWSTVYQAIKRRRERAQAAGNLCTSAIDPGPAGNPPGEELEHVPEPADQVKGSE